MRATPATVDYAALATHQAACPLTQLAASSTSLQIEKRVVGGVELLSTSLEGGVRPLILLVNRPAVFAAFHELAHAGTRATKRLIAARVMWCGLNSDVAAWVKNCQKCEGFQATHGGDPAHRHPSQAVHPHPHGHRGPPASGHLWQQVLVHSGGQVVTLVRGPPHAGHCRHQLRRRSHRRLDLQILGTGAADLRQGYAVYLCHLGRLVPAAGHPAPANHCFPPSSKWYGREVPPPAERCPAGPPCMARLASTPSLGPDGAESRPPQRTQESPPPRSSSARRWCCRGRSSTRESRHQPISSPNCGNPVRRCLRVPSPIRRWRTSRRRHSSQRHSSTSGRAARSLPCRRSTAARTESLPLARRFSGYR
jgi:hypothetical protein